MAKHKKPHESKLFRGGPGSIDLRLNSCFAPSDDWSYAAGFKGGADVVADHILASVKDPPIADEAYVVLFLYRHYLELQLKYLLLLEQKLQSTPKPSLIDRVRTRLLAIRRRLRRRRLAPSVMEQHNLAKLWNSTKEMLRRRGNDINLRECKLVEMVVNEFHQVDMSGQESRYPRTMRGKRSLDRIAELDLGHLKATMAGVYSYLGDHTKELEMEFDSENHIDY